VEQEGNQKEVISVPMKNVLEKSVEVSSGALGCLVGVSHCLNMIEESSYIKFEPGFSQSFIEDVGQKYNIATQHSSLLLLHDAQQFFDNNVPCPPNHPQHGKWKQLKAAADVDKETSEISDKINKIEKLHQIVKFVEKLISMSGESKIPSGLDAKLKGTKELILQIESIWSDCRNFVGNSIQSVLNNHDSQMIKCSNLELRLKSQLVELQKESDQAKLDKGLNMGKIEFDSLAVVLSDTSAKTELEKWKKKSLRKNSTL